MESRSWMYDRTNPGQFGLKNEFVPDVYDFVDYAKTLEDFTIHGVVRCPCSKSECMKFKTPEIVRRHLMEKGFKSNYTVWTSHEETRNSLGGFLNFVVGESSRMVEPNVQNSRMHDMVQDAYGMHLAFESGGHVEESPNEEANHFYKKLNQASRPLHDGSTHSKLFVVVRLLNIKADNNVSQGAMNSVIDLMHELVNPTLEILDNYYKAKRLVSKLGLSSVRINCCENGCMLYYNDDVNLESCKFCGSECSAPHLRWHNENRRPPGVMCHPSDGEAWKHFDRTYPDFAVEPRNVRLGLYSDGFTPHSGSAASYSCWPVFITPYNLPPEMFDELKQFWVEGVETYDNSGKQNFNLRAALMWTINDFPVYGMLSGWMTAGKRMKNAFKNNTIEQDFPPPILSGEDIWERVQHLPKVTEEEPYRFDGYGVYHTWTKQSIFWELSHWKDNLLRHNLDVMHIEKNYFDNLFNTVIDVKDKTKDNVKARMDLIEYCGRKELWLQPKQNRFFKPKAKLFFHNGAEVKEL
ncbi:uncharacterized protein LOC132613209 [Lycium barbarum]|uniref:uncharacterized protein LOC132613209 n=1 Tax=Lycium barbarum TaxID=112863 RepID=UPI00293E5032|nr:uncharacterized protein LOC132613209 [Lycium barbarum]